jgi:hypothetical protein
LRRGSGSRVVAGSASAASIALTISLDSRFL